MMHTITLDVTPNGRTLHLDMNLMLMIDRGISVEYQGIDSEGAARVGRATGWLD